tara:strand:+ start:1745 stop:2056 length:312 start_codon:yes stop_codon:yes gene_type:complete
VVNGEVDLWGREQSQIGRFRKERKDLSQRSVNYGRCSQKVSWRSLAKVVGISKGRGGAWACKREINAVRHEEIFQSALDRLKTEKEASALSFPRVAPLSRKQS